MGKSIVKPKKLVGGARPKRVTKTKHKGQLWQYNKNLLRAEMTHPHSPQFKITLDKITRDGDYGERPMSFVNITLRKGEQWALIGSTVTVQEAKAIVNHFVKDEYVDVYWRNADIYK